MFDNAKEKLEIKSKNHNKTDRSSARSDEDFCSIQALNSRKHLKRKDSGSKALVRLFLVLIIILGGYFAYSARYTKIFFPNTYIYGIDISNKNPEEAGSLIKQYINDYSIRVKLSEVEERTLTAEQLGLKYVCDDTVSRIIKKQDSFAWILHVFVKKDIKPENIFKLDESVLKSSVINLNASAGSESVVISKYIDKEGYKLLPQAQTEGVNAEKAMEAIKAAALSLDKEIDLTDPKLGIYVEIGSQDTNKELEEKIKVMNNSLKSVIKYDNGTTLDINTIKDWLSLDINGEIVIKHQAVEDFVAELAKSYNTVYKPRIFTTTTGETVTISGGSYGWKVNQIGEASALKKLILEGREVERTPEFLKTAASKTAPDYGNTYIEVNLSTQHLYYYREGLKLFETDFVSGNEAEGNMTPTGTYQITHKRKNATLINEGRQDVARYWLPFNGNIGFNSTSWRNSFGGDIYKTEGSKGNINLSSDTARILFEYVDDGTPVLCFTTGTPNALQAQKVQEESETSELETAVAENSVMESSWIQAESKVSMKSKKNKKQKETVKATEATDKTKNKKSDTLRTTARSASAAQSQSSTISNNTSSAAFASTPPVPTQQSNIPAADETVPKLNEPIRSNSDGGGIKRIIR